MEKQYLRRVKVPPKENTRSSTFLNDGQTIQMIKGLNTQVHTYLIFDYSFPTSASHASNIYGSSQPLPSSISIATWSNPIMPPSQLLYKKKGMITPQRLQTLYLFGSPFRCKYKALELWNGVVKKVERRLDVTHSDGRQQVPCGNCYYCTMDV